MLWYSEINHVSHREILRAIEGACKPGGDVSGASSGWCTSLPHAPQTAAADKHPWCLQRAQASSATTHVMLEQLDALRMLQGVLTSDLLTEQLCTNMSPLLTGQGTERGSINTLKF